MAALLAACLDPRIAAIDADFSGRSYEAPGSWPTSPQDLPTISRILCHGDIFQWAAVLADRRVTLRGVRQPNADRRWLEGVFRIAGGKVTISSVLRLQNRDP